jgi:hypothetical protein
MSYAAHHLLDNVIDGRAKYALPFLSRDNLDENGGGNLEIDAAAGSGAMIIRCSKLCKHFFSTSLVDCR